MIADLDRVQRLGDGAFMIHRHGQPPLLIAWAKPGFLEVTLPVTIEGDRLMRITDAAAGSYAYESVPVTRVVPLGALPVLAGAVLPGESQAVSSSNDSSTAQ
jgi:hypothetical protein